MHQLLLHLPIDSRISTCCMQESLIPATRGNSRFYFLVAFSLINTLVITLLLCAAGFLIGLPVGKWPFPMACVLAFTLHYAATRFFASGKSMRLFFRSSGLVIILLFASVFFSGCLYDVSFDGQWYHQETVSVLKQGYNPIYQQLSLPQDEDMGDVSVGWCTGVDRPIPNQPRDGAHSIRMKVITLNNFSKGMEVIEAAIYQMTGRIETAKAANGILIAASFFLCLSLLYKTDRIGTYKKWVLAALFAFNPIALTQLNSFCIDGDLACTLVCLLAINLLLLDEVNRYHLLLLGSVIILAVNIKFTNVVYTLLFCGTFLSVQFVCKKREAFKQVLRVGIISGAIGLCFCGFNPYITNWMGKRNLFYGLDEARYGVRLITPPLFLKMNRFETLFFSLSAHQGWNSATKNSIWEIPKIPFTLNKEDIVDAKDCQQELSAFGPFFSGVLLLAIPFYFVLLVRFRKNSTFQLLSVLSLMLLLSVLLMPDPWWGRYVPQLWLIPLVIAIMGELHPLRGGRCYSGLMYLAASLNIAWAATGWVSNLSTSARIDYQMRQLRAVHQPVNIEYCPRNTFKSNQVRFEEWGIPIREKTLVGPYVYNVVESNTRFETPVPLPDLPRPLLLRWAIRITGNDIPPNR